MDALNIVEVVVLLLCCGVGVLLTAVRLPGTWLIAAVGLGYGWWSEWQGLGVLGVCVVAGIAVVGEVLELLASVVLARRAGASRRAAWGGLIGGVAGMILFSFPLLGPPFSTMIGALVGCFLGGMLAELSAQKDLTQGAKVGLFSAIGLALGATIKVGVALVMSAIVLASAVCSQAEEIGNAVDLSQ